MLKVISQVDFFNFTKRFFAHILKKLRRIWVKKRFSGCNKAIPVLYCFMCN